MPFRRGLVGARYIRAVGLLVVLGGADSRVRGANPPESPVPSEPVFTALRSDGQTAAGRLVALAADRLVLSGDENAREELPLRSLVKLTRDVRPAGPGAESSSVLLPDGDRLAQVGVGSSNETSVEVQCRPPLGRLTVPLDAILGLVLAPPAESAAADQLWDRVLAEARKSDVLWLSNGDRLAGGFLGIDDRVVKLQVDGKPAELDRAGVLAVGFDPAVLNYPRPASDFLEFTFADGSRLGMSTAALKKGEITATTRFGQQVRFGVGDVTMISPRTPAVVYLSERPADAEQYVPYIGPTRPYRRDRGVEGRGLQLSGRLYDRGLGTQSRTLLAYRLKPGDRRFQAAVGVDDRAGPLASVAFRVLVDGKERFSSPPMACRDVPRQLDIDIENAKSLILVTEFGDRGDVRDHADWVEARIVR